MVPFLFDKDHEGAHKKRGNGISWPPPVNHAQHRRSKSASERNLDASGDGALRSMKKNQNGTHMSPLPNRAYRTRSPLHEYPTCTNNNTSSNHRASLEKDIEVLQLRLQQEKSMRMMLERAMGRASSTLSPGHRHFATQTKELISEIELLEEEVANREQHVLSLYRSIFEQKVSRDPSQQNSYVASPAHIKQASRKHPSIISSAFCSSKKFPLRPLQALVSISESGKRSSKACDAPPSIGKSDIQFEKTCFDRMRTHEKIPTMEKTSMLRPLKDHLYQCPSKLSEEMVRCMAAVYCWLRSTASVAPGKNRSPILSRSSTNVVLPRRGIVEDRDWSCKSMVEISWISTDKNHFSHASYAINNYRVLVEKLERVTVSQMENNAQVAFWINVYNALVMHVKITDQNFFFSSVCSRNIREYCLGQAYLAYGIPHNSLRRLALFHKAAYNIGGHIVSANAIEQSIFCFRTPRVGKWLETILSTALRKKSSEERQLITSKFGLSDAQPLVCFALCTGAFSDPVLKVYMASSVKEELEEAKREFLQANVVVKKSRKVFLPKLLERFAKEASMSSDDLLKWVTENVDKKLHDSIQKCIDHKSRKSSQIIEWLPYSSRFQYLFSKDLMEKPLWV
ncbi:uncharacterized protein LOC105632278 isoform X3 [Jatropha curcas]|uniref:uncharacterized protein LOC105632278 isoform X3 n=1 Tax=Jatropha curcas TaxID=180498 RepID=UPI0009D75854|nr:uncharacterized protein LOC105632278 isoform X3 [Jatropha curcas]XP_037494041.1 uncharacterized protein LOC105632278 isoform X3 [Jatropha curcas]